MKLLSTPFTTVFMVIAGSCIRHQKSITTQMSLIYSIDSTVGRFSRSSIYIGGKNDAKNRAWLEDIGVTHILNVTPPKEVGIKVRVRVPCIS